MEMLLLYVVYPLIVAGVLGVFGFIYSLFGNMLKRIQQTELIATDHHARLSFLERRHRP